MDGWEGQLSSEAKHLAALHLQSLDAHFGFDLDWVDCLKKRSTPIRRLDISDENPSFYRIEWDKIPQPPVPFGLCGFAKYPPAKQVEYVLQARDSLRGKHRSDIHLMGFTATPQFLKAVQELYYVCDGFTIYYWKGSRRHGLDTREKLYDALFALMKELHEDDYDEDELHERLDIYDEPEELVD